MILHHAFLALVSLALLGVIAAQDWLVIPLRNETISSGLTGPFHAVLDAAYVPLAAAMFFSFPDRGWMDVCASVSGIALLLVAATNTAWRWFDTFTDGGHAKLHSFFTLVVFISALALQVLGDRVTGWWGITAATVAVPGIAYAFFRFRPTAIKGVTISASPAAEKLYVLGLCGWLMMWGLAGPR